jgi:7-keto-8-aminopelargonate synthetase-like enzyme
MTRARPVLLPEDEFPRLAPAGGNTLRVGRRTRLHFSGCDYFRLSRHPEVVAAFTRTAETDGLGVAASRLTTGNHPLYGRLETALARLMGAEGALLTGAGYLAASAWTQALAGEVGLALLDEQAHPSLRDASLLLGCPVRTFRHRDPAHAARLARRRRRPGRVLLLTDGVFSLTGEIAPLAEYLAALPRDALLLVDDAHGLGVLGPRGEGTPAVAGGAGSPRLLRVATLSKALGGFGGVLAGPLRWLRRAPERSRLFGGSTPPPLPVVAAALLALRVLRRDRSLRARLRERTAQAKAGFAAAGFPQPENDVPILVLRLPTAPAARRFTAALDRAGIFARPLNYPGARGRHFRFALSSEHQPEDIARLLASLPARSIPRDTGATPSKQIPL